MTSSHDSLQGTCRDASEADELTVALIRPFWKRHTQRQERSEAAGGYEADYSRYYGYPITCVGTGLWGINPETVCERRKQVNNWRSFCLVSAVLLVSLTATAQEQGVVRPQPVLREIVKGMPRGDKQEVRVLNVSFKPGDRTLFHTHRFPVTVYVLEGVFTMEMGGREPITVKAGEAGIMPPHVNMTGYNRSGSDTLRLVAFYVSDPDTPFLDPIQ